MTQLPRLVQRSDRLIYTGAVIRRCLPLPVCLLLAFCGGGGTGPSPGGNPNPSNPFTFTITSAGVSPKELTVPLGTRVLFVNRDTRRHDMDSDPHPEHDDCPEINVGPLNPGQSRETQNLNTVRTCAFHDHDLPDDDTLKGRIIIR
jgi:plastocyanin